MTGKHGLSIKKKKMTNKLRTAKRAMESEMLNLTLQDKIPCPEIRKRTKLIYNI